MLTGGFSLTEFFLLIGLQKVHIDRDEIISPELFFSTSSYVWSRGGSRGGRGPGGQDPPFGGPPNFIKREKTLCVCAKKRRVLVHNSYPHPPFRNPVSAPDGL